MFPAAAPALLRYTRSKSIAPGRVCPHDRCTAGPSRGQTGGALMALFAFLVVSLGICLVPVYAVRRRGYARAQDYFVSGEHAPPGVVQNSSVAYALQMATFGPLFAWGASGDCVPALLRACS